MEQNKVSQVIPTNIIQSAVQNGQKLLLTENRDKLINSQSQLSLTVVNISNQNIQLQVQGTKERLLVPLDQLRIDGRLRKGDVLTLVAIKNDNAKLIVSSNIEFKPSSAQLRPLEASLLRELIKNWPNINLPDVSKVELFPRDEVVLKSASSQKALIDTILRISSSDLLRTSVKVDAQIISKSENAISVTKLGGSISDNLTLPLEKSFIKELLGKENLSLSLKLNKSDTANVIISDIKIDGKSIPQRQIQYTNTNLSNASKVIIERLFKEQVLPQNTQKNGSERLILNGTPKLLESIGFTNLSSDPKAGESSYQLAISKEKLGQNIASIVKLIAKPTIVNTALQNILVNDKSNPKDFSLSVQSKELYSSKLNQKPLFIENGTTNQSLKQAVNQLLTNKQINELASTIKDQITKLVPYTQGQESAVSEVFTEISATLRRLSPETRNIILELLPPASKRTLMKVDELPNAKLANEKNKVDGIQQTTGSNPTENQKQTIDKTLPENIDTELLRELVSAKVALNFTRASTTSNNNIMEALVNMLSIRLFAKLEKQMATNPASATLLREIKKDASNVLGASRVKTVSNELDQIDSNNQLLRALSKASIQSRAQALRSADVSLQSQDTSFFTLPNMLFPSNKDIQLSIRRETADQKDSKAIEKAWCLDMNMEICEQGNILAKVKLVRDAVDINLYADNDKLKRKTEKYLPMLLERLSSLGISVNKHGCYQTKDTSISHSTKLNCMDTFI